MVIAANASVGKSWAHHATGILAGLMAGAVFLFGVFDLSTRGNPPAFDYGIMVTGLAAAALASKPVRERAARIIPIDPDNPVHSIALVLGVILLGSSIALFLFVDVLATDLKVPPLSLADLVGQEVPFLVMAFAGVGLWIRRDLATAAARLGLVVPAWWQLPLALAAAGAFYALAVGFHVVGQALTPGLTERVDASSGHVFSGLVSPAGIVALALIPGICEDFLFRGALQPRFGLVLTALLFAAIHTEYAFSIDALAIFTLAIGLGLIRKYANTTTSAACHVTYNLLVGLNLSGVALDAAIAVEVVLVAVAGFALWSGRRRLQEPVAESSGVR